jgi:hypothetical protein
MKISTFVGDLNLIYVVERDIFYKTVSQFLDNLLIDQRNHTVCVFIHLKLLFLHYLCTPSLNSTSLAWVWCHRSDPDLETSKLIWTSYSSFHYRFLIAVPKRSNYNHQRSMQRQIRTAKLFFGMSLMSQVWPRSGN